MKTYLYNEPVYDKGEIVGNQVIEKTEDQIIEEYFPYWSAVMKTVGKEDQINRKNCIDDWKAVNWAWEKQDDTQTIQQ